MLYFWKAFTSVIFFFTFMLPRGVIAVFFLVKLEIVTREFLLGLILSL